MQEKVEKEIDFLYPKGHCRILVGQRALLTFSRKQCRVLYIVFSEDTF